MIPKYLVPFLFVVMACVSISSVSGRELKDVAPACSGSKCYTCSGEVAPVISGSVCTCNGGEPCREVGTSLNGAIANATNAMNTAAADAVNAAQSAVSNAMNAANEAVSNALSTANEAVSNAMNVANEAKPNAASCPQGDGQGGSRCGTVDLIGYCEDQCGSGDGACCIDSEPVCAC